MSSHMLMLGGRLTPWVMRLIIINFLVYLAELISFQWLGQNFMYRHLALVPIQFATRWEFWQVFTYAFLHDAYDPTHLLFNMFGLWMFGSIFERAWGARRFLAFYILSAAGAGVAVVLVSLVASSQWAVPTVGASGAIYALLVAYGVNYPNQPVYFYAFLPIKGKHLVLILIGSTVLFALARSPISYAAHFGGMVIGFLASTDHIRNLWERAKKGRPKRSSPDLRLIRPPDDKDQYLH